jgi:hypothetical protein
VSLFIEFPLLAAAVGAAFVGLYLISRRSAAAVAAVAWLGYGAYELGMTLRWLCTGECNIRVDLLLIYPVLLAITVAGVVSVVRWLARRQRTD